MKSLKKLCIPQHPDNEEHAKKGADVHGVAHGVLRNRAYQKRAREIH